MQSYVAFWRANQEHEKLFALGGSSEFHGYFTTVTMLRDKKTVCLDINGKERMVFPPYKRRPREVDVDTKIREMSVLDAGEVTEFAKQNGAESTFGPVDFIMTEEAAETVEEKFAHGLKLVKWEDYMTRWDYYISGRRRK